MIPLRDGNVSVGAVCSPAYLKKRQGSNGEFLMQTLRAIPDVRRRMAHAEIVGNLHATGNYSYTCNQLGGRRWLLVGDAYAFVDPIFRPACISPCIAVSSPQISWSRRCASGSASGHCKGVTRNVRQGISSLSWFIFRFNTPGIAWLFRNPRNLLRVEEAMISMLAGDVFRDNGVKWRLQFFKLLYYITSTAYWRESLASWRDRRRSKGLNSKGTPFAGMRPDSG